MGENYLADIPMEKHGSVQVYVPANAGDTDVKHPIFQAPHKMKVIAAKVIYQAAITGQATNYITAKVINAGTDGAGTTVIGSKAYTNGVDAAVLVPEDLTLSGTAADLIVKAGETLAYLSDMTGSSVPDDTQKIVQIDYQLQ